MQNLNIQNVEEARELIRASKKQVNPSNVKLKKKVFCISVNNQSDFDFLNAGLVGMQNVKWMYIKLEGQENDI